MPAPTSAVKQTSGTKITYTLTYEGGITATVIVYKNPAAPGLRWSMDTTWPTGADWASWSSMVADLDAQLAALGLL